MAIGLRHNSVSMMTANHLNDSATAMSRSVGKISSGSRIDQIGEDAAGAAVSINMSARARSGKQAVRNANDAISLLHTSGAALKETKNILDRIRELAVQSSSETMASDERKYIVTEYKELTNEVLRFIHSSEFNGQSIAKGETFTAQVGTDGDDNHQITITAADIKTIHSNLATVNLTSADNAQASIKRVDKAMDISNLQEAQMGAVHNRLLNAINNEVANNFNLSRSASQITDTDMAQETTMMAALQVKHSAGAAAMGQANGISQSILSLI